MALNRPNKERAPSPLERPKSSHTLPEKEANRTSAMCSCSPRNTVSSHVRHIYRKIDVHSKQELIEMVETRRVEQGPRKA